MQIKRSIMADQLEKMRRESEERVAVGRAERAGLPYINLNTTPVQTDALGLLDEKEARVARMAIIERREKHEGGEGGEIAVALVDPNDSAAKRIIKNFEKRGFKVNVFLGSLTGLERVWGFYQFVTPEAKAITGRVAVGGVGKEDGKKRLEILQKQLVGLGALKSAIARATSASELLEVVVLGALVNRASDIHIEPSEKNVMVRNRIDGILHLIENLSRDQYSSLVNRIKLLSNLKLNIKEESQDGRFSFTLLDRDIEIRVSVIPAEFGEMVVMRLLDPKSIQVELTDLGLRPDDLEIVKNNLARPNGMVINTGPTGSGKTTTLYAFLKSVAKADTKVITIEDPIEYRLEWVEQTQVDPGAGYTFANGLRAILRQDPDVVLVGEIRDAETADIAIQASLTGHLVFSTLHTNDAAGAIPRLINLGVSTAVIGPALNLIIAQRLVRKLCEECKKPVTIEKDLEGKIKKFLEKLPKRVDLQKYATMKIFEPGGVDCKTCDGLGYRGRIAIFELLEVTKKIQELIDKKATITAFADASYEAGMVSLVQDGVLKILEGITTFDEVEKIAGRIEW